MSGAIVEGDPKTPKESKLTEALDKETMEQEIEEAKRAFEATKREF